MRYFCFCFIFIVIIIITIIIHFHWEFLTFDINFALISPTVIPLVTTIIDGFVAVVVAADIAAAAVGTTAVVIVEIDFDIVLEHTDLYYYYFFDS